MKRLMWPIFLVLAACLAGAAPAAAQEFQVATADVNQNGFLITVFREIGLSPGTQVVYTYQADVTATYGCLPNGYSVNKKKVPDIPKETVSEVGVTRWETLDVGNKGKVVDGMAIDPPEPPSTLVASHGDLQQRPALEFKQRSDDEGRLERKLRAGARRHRDLQ
jgi:hypothetical protein